MPADELARAKNYVALRFPGGFESTSDISRRLEDVLTYRLPEDYFSRYVPGIMAVTGQDVQRVARTFIQPDKLAVVVVGDRKDNRARNPRAEPRANHGPDDRRGLRRAPKP